MLLPSRNRFQIGWNFMSASRSRTLVYYFAFPHYRLSILRELASMSSGEIDFAAGVVGLDEIAVLRRQELPGLRELRSIRLGPFTWQRGVFRRAVDGTYTDVILGPSTRSLTTWAVLLTRRLCQRRTLLWGQCGRVGERGVKRCLQEVMNRLASGLLVYGSAESRAATELGTPPSKVHVVHNATRSNRDYLSPDFSVQAWDRLRKWSEVTSKSGALNLLYVGRLNRSKHVDALLEAMHLIRRTFPAARVDVYGDGDDAKRLRGKYDQEYVHFHGWEYDPETLRRVFSGATMVCSPYHMGLVAVDALRYGVPVLVPDNPHNGSEVEALAEGINSVRFVPGDPQAISGAVTQWLKIARSISADEFVDARSRALMEWEPAEVAVRILGCLTSD